MKIFRLIIISVIILFTIVTLISFLVPSRIRISKAINIKAEPVNIFGYIENLSKWQEWHPAFISSSQKKIENIDSINGKINKLVVDGTLIKLKTTDLNKIVFEIEVQDKNPVINEWFISGSPAPGLQTLHGSMEFKLRWYPWEKFSSLFFENIYGDQLQKGLNNLKLVSEQ